MRVAPTPSDPDEFAALIRYIASLPHRDQGAGRCQFAGVLGSRF